MVGGKKRRASSQLAGSHQRCWLWGRHAVLESLRAARWIPLELHIDRDEARSGQLAEAISLAAPLHVPVIESSSVQLTKLCRSAEHQGLLAKMPVYPYAPFQHVLDKLKTEGQPAFVLLLDGIQDPHNFGAILRSAEVFGADAVIVPARGQAEVSLHVARSAAGGVNFLNISQVESLPEAARQLHSLGIRLLGASEKGTSSPADVDLRRPTALVIGNEGAGLSPELTALCDPLVCIPQSGRVGSLNAAVAAGILCYELRRQRK